MSHQAKSSSVAPPQSSLRSRASAFIPLVTASINKMTTCTTPKNSEKGGGYKPRAAPQCSSSTRRPSSSPTSVVSAHHHTPRNGNGHYNKGGGGGGGFFVEGASPSPIKKKYKTEMCKNMLEDGFCRFGVNCHYAHSEDERHSPSVEDLLKDDRLLLPCPIMVATGKCPYDHRCKSLHDPRVDISPNVENHETLVVLEHCTKAKRNGETIPDRLYHRYLNSIRQINPLIVQSIWETRRSSSGSNADMELMDTINLVCNSGPGINVLPKSKSTRPMSSLARARSRGGNSYSDVVNKNNPHDSTLSELQRLCIVLEMHTDVTHLDFVYSPTDCMSGQPCMVLQTRYFQLLDMDQLQETPSVSIDNIIKEVNFDVYNVKKYKSPGAFVCVHEVAFDSKGKRSCNLSLWFDTDKMITACSGSKAKKMSKKEEPWRLSDKSLSLFCLPNNDEFDLSTVPTPYVCMQPVDDSKAGHDLIKDIIVHKVATILMAKGFCFTASPSDLGQLKKDYFRIKSDMERWAWSKTSEVNHFFKTKEEQNKVVYSPSRSAWSKDSDEDGSITTNLWSSFVKNMNSDPSDTHKPTLPVFGTIMKTTDDSNSDHLPFLQPASPSPTGNVSNSLSEATWREVLLGEGDAWERTIQAHIENAKKNGAARSSTELFV